jgi:hypothetical protein
MDEQRKAAKDEVPVNQTKTDAKPGAPVLPKEIGGREGLEPTRYGDWEKNGRCIDF